MKKSLLFSLLFFVSIVASADTYTVAYESSRMRDNPSSGENSRVLRLLKKGAQVKVLAKKTSASGHWSLVEVNGAKGWINSNLLRLPTAASMSSASHLTPTSVSEVPLPVPVPRPKDVPLPIARPSAKVLRVMPPSANVPVPAPRSVNVPLPVPRPADVPLPIPRPKNLADAKSTELNKNPTAPIKVIAPPTAIEPAAVDVPKCGQGSTNDPKKVENKFGKLLSFTHAINKTTQDDDAINVFFHPQLTLINNQGALYIHLVVAGLLDISQPASVCQDGSALNATIDNSQASGMAAMAGKTITMAFTKVSDNQVHILAKVAGKAINSNFTVVAPSAPVAR